MKAITIILLAGLMLSVLALSGYLAACAARLRSVGSPCANGGEATMAAADRAEFYINSPRTLEFYACWPKDTDPRELRGVAVALPVLLEYWADRLEALAAGETEYASWLVSPLGVPGRLPAGQENCMARWPWPERGEVGPDGMKELRAAQQFNQALNEGDGSYKP